MKPAATLRPENIANADFESLIQQLQHSPGSVNQRKDVDDRPLYGRTLFIADCPLETWMGSFHAYIFQDIIDKHYVVTLTHGDYTRASELTARIHSSCITSETLRGCDCDCVQQLEGAFEAISKRGSGVLFYLMQEGRGVGYVSKARDRMLVQASGDELTTFHAYACMGLKKDHRSYESIADICHLLGICAPLRLLTNNRDKVDALRALGIEVASTEPLEFAPSPFNLAYLKAKAASGHHLPGLEAQATRSARPPEPVAPFRPRAIPGAKRFIYTASYFLPIKPVDNDVVLSVADFRTLFPGDSFDQACAAPDPLVRSYFLLRDNRVFVKINPDALTAKLRQEPDSPLRALVATPYWFRTHVYYDLVTSNEFVVLTYGEPRIYDLPVVRLHSESLFNRFPLRELENRDKFKLSVKHIVTYGVGAIILLYNDGRGAGFGAYATDLMLSFNNLALSTDEAYRLLGVGYESRDYDASMLLLKQHIPNEKIQMVMNSPSSLVRKTEYAEALRSHQIDVGNWIFLENSSSPA